MERCEHMCLRMLGCRRKQRHLHANIHAYKQNRHTQPFHSECIWGRDWAAAWDPYRLYVSLATTKGLSSCRVVRPRAFHLPLLAAAAALAIGPAPAPAPAATSAVAVAVAAAMANTTSATNSHTIGPGQYRSMPTSGRQGHQGKGSWCAGEGSGHGGPPQQCTICYLCSEMLYATFTYFVFHTTSFFDFQDAMYPLMSNFREHLVSHHVAVSFQLIFGVLG